MAHSLEVQINKHGFYYWNMGVLCGRHFCAQDFAVFHSVLYVSSYFYYLEVYALYLVGYDTKSFFTDV